MLKILGEIFAVKIEPQVLDSAVGMHGAGEYGAQCGLTEGSLMFLGILCSERNYAKEEIVESCYDFAEQFEAEFGSLICSKLRPEGFKPDNPPHLCEGLSKKAVEFAVNFIDNQLEN